MKSDLRVTLTKRMLKEGLLRCMERTPLSRITVSELCRQAGVNRATFYNHYQSLDMVLRDITRDYESDLREVYESNLQGSHGDRTQAMRACLGYLDDRRASIQVLFSDNAENNTIRFAEEILDEVVSNRKGLTQGALGQNDDKNLLYAIITASASYGLIRAWILGLIDKTPEELANLITDVFGEGVA